MDKNQNATEKPAERLPKRYEDLPPTPAEIMEATNRLVSANNEERERLRVARDNRRRGYDEPRPGSKMYVSLDRTIEARRRAGVRFERGHRFTVLVVDASDAEVALAQEEIRMPDGKALPAGVDGVVNPWGAEQILADDALTVHQNAASPEDAEQLRRENEALAVEASKLREEVASLRSVRDARISAGPSEHGEPSRLIAAREATSRAAAAAATHGEEFGKDPGNRTPTPSPKDPVVKDPTKDPSNRR
jgi:hypothetical protein